MVFALTMVGERVEQAELLAAADQPSLRQALGPPEVAEPLVGPLLLSAACPHCACWVLATDEMQCPLCGNAL